MVRLLLAVLTGLPSLLSAQPDIANAGVQTPAAQGAQAAGLGGAGLALPTDGWTRIGALTSLTAPGISLAAEQRFGLAELREGSAQAVARWRGYAFSLQAASFGSDALRSSQFGLGLAHELSSGGARRLAVGLRVEVVSVSAEGYGTGVGGGLSPSVWAEVTDALSVAVEARNVLMRRVSGREPVPSEVRAGTVYAASDRVRLVADLTHDPDFGASVHAGAELDLAGMLTARAGIGTDPQQIGLGARLRAGPLRADLAATRHLLLGWSPSIEVGWQW
jgi:hypothetical protein